jgi:hypothetical protein
MAHTAVSSADQSTIRGALAHTITGIHLDIVAPQTVVTLTVTAVPATIPFINLTVSGSMTDVSIGQLVHIADGSTHKTWGVVRKAPSGTTLFITPVSLGDPGYPEAIENLIEVGDTVTVYTHRPLFGLYSTIRAATFYKSWDVPYSDQNESPPPVANTGPWQRATVAVGSTATFTLPKAGSNTSFALGAKTVDTYLWTLPTGVTLVDGYADSDDVIEVTASAGQHLVSLTITDSDSKTHTAYVWLFVEDGSTYTSFGSAYLWNIDRDEQTRQGREMSFTVTLRADDPALDESVILPHAGVLFTVDHAFSGDTVTDGVMVDTYIGYVTDLEYSHDGNYGTVTITTQAPLILAKDIVQPPQVLADTANPARWTECNSVMSNPRGALYYAIKWHTPALLDMHDFDGGDLTTPRRKSYDYGTNNLYAACEVAANNILGNVGSVSDGTTVLRQSPMYEDNTFRNALATVWTWLAQDVKAPLRYGRKRTMPTGELRGGGFSYDGATIGAWMGIKRWYQGVGKPTIPDFSVTASDGLDRVKEVVGHAMAEANNPTPELILDIQRHIDIIDPAYMVWHGLTVSSDYDPRGVGWTAARLLPVRVSRRWNNDEFGVTCDISVTMQTESYGMPGEELPIGSAQGSISEGWSIGAEPYEPVVDSIPNLLLTWNTTGYWARTKSLLDTTPHYQDLSGAVTGTINDMCWDYTCDFFANGFNLLDSLRAFVVTTDDTDLNVYRIDDVRDPVPTVTLLETYTMNDDSCTTEARVQVSREVPDNVGVAWHDQTGVLVGRSYDGGETWEVVEQVGETITDEDNDNAPLGFALVEDDWFVSAPNADGQYGVYWSIADAGFTEATNTEYGDAPCPCIMPDGDGNYWVGVTAGNASSVLRADFDDYFDYDSIAFAPTIGTSTLTAEGNPDTGYAAEFTVATPPSTTSTNVISVKFDLTDWYPCDISVEFDAYKDTAGVNAQPRVQLEYNSAYHNNTAIAAEETWENFSYSGISITDPDVYVQARYNYLVGNAPTVGDLVRLDNIIITNEDAEPTDPKLYFVEGYNDTDTWNDVTPGTDHIPMYPYALSVDLTDPDNIIVMGTNDDDTRYYESANQGTSWTDNGVDDYIAAKQLADTRFLAGDSILEIDVNGTVYGREGDLDLQWSGGIGTLKGFLVLI